jgi:hypothetical protein
LENRAKFCSSAYQKKIIFSFVKLLATKNGLTKFFFHPCLLLLFAGSGMGKNQDPGSGINIPDPPH